MIRPFVEDDLEQLLEAWYQASLLAHPFLENDFLEQERQNIPNIYLPVADTWVCEKTGKVVGFIALIGNEVGAMFVHPEFHGQGLGKALMDQACSLHESLVLDVFTANRIGRRFYARYGFVVQEERTHEPTGQPLLRLHWQRGDS